MHNGGFEERGAVQVIPKDNLVTTLGSSRPLALLARRLFSRRVASLVATPRIPIAG